MCGSLSAEGEKGNFSFPMLQLYGTLRGDTQISTSRAATQLKAEWEWGSNLEESGAGGWVGAEEGALA